MTPLPSRKALEEMKRADLQRICKEYGVKANLKSDALIDLLLDTQTPAPAPQPTRRSVSVRQSSRAGPSRVSSMIVHDFNDEEGGQVDDLDEITKSERAESEKLPSPTPMPAPRTRKAKELQTKLGVGRPVIAGGSGPRAVTRSSGSSKGKRAKSSKSIKPREATIEEEPETISALKDQLEKPQEEESSSPTKPLPPENYPLTDVESTNAPIIDIKQLIADTIRPLQDQIRTLQLELSQLTSIKLDYTSLQEQVADVRKAQTDLRVEIRSLRELESTVASLNDEVKLLKEERHTPPRPSTPKPRTGQQRSIPIGFGLPSVMKNVPFTSPTISTNPESRLSPSLPHMGIRESTLGKRHRNSTSSDVPDVVEEGQETELSDGELAKTVIRPSKKRPKVQKDRTRSNEKTRAVASSSRVASTSNEQAGSSSSNRIGSGFIIYRGSEDPVEYIDPPPPTDHLPDFFDVDSPLEPSSNQQGTRSTSGIPTSTANASENQFNFAFAPMSSTPANDMYMTSFPYPEPQSPSPAGTSLTVFPSRHQEERTDIFKTFGLPSPVRSTRHYGALSNDERGVNPAALIQGPSVRREVSSNDVAAGLGLTTIRTTSSSEPAATEVPTIRRTMYGTELEGDTRFGDFGVEGVASGFWLSKQ